MRRKHLNAIHLVICIVEWRMQYIQSNKNRPLHYCIMRIFMNALFFVRSFLSNRLWLGMQLLQSEINTRPMQYYSRISNLDVDDKAAGIRVSPICRIARCLGMQCVSFHSNPNYLTNIFDVQDGKVCVKTAAIEWHTWKHMNNWAQCKRRSEDKRQLQKAAHNKSRNENENAKRKTLNKERKKNNKSFLYRSHVHAVEVCFCLRQSFFNGERASEGREYLSYNEQRKKAIEIADNTRRKKKEREWVKKVAQQQHRHQHHQQLFCNG